jgi:hypothetical protein
VSNRLLRAVLALYPRAFRRRYGAEVQDLVNDLEAAGDRSRLRLVSGLLISAAEEQLRAARQPARLTMATLLAVAAVGMTVVVNWSRGRQRFPRPVAGAATHTPRAFRSSTRLGQDTSSSGKTVAIPVLMRLRNGWAVVEPTGPPPPPPPPQSVAGHA